MRTWFDDHQDTAKFARWSLEDLKRRRSDRAAAIEDAQRTIDLLDAEISKREGAHGHVKV